MPSYITNNSCKNLVTRDAQYGKRLNQQKSITITSKQVSRENSELHDEWSSAVPQSLEKIFYAFFLLFRHKTVWNSRALLQKFLQTLTLQTGLGSHQRRRNTPPPTVKWAQEVERIDFMVFARRMHWLWLELSVSKIAQQKLMALKILYPVLNLPWYTLVVTITNRSLGCTSGVTLNVACFLRSKSVLKIVVLMEMICINHLQNYLEIQWRIHVQLQILQMQIDTLEWSHTKLCEAHQTHMISMQDTKLPCDQGRM